MRTEKPFIARESAKRFRASTIRWMWFAWIEKADTEAFLREPDTCLHHPHGLARAEVRDALAYRHRHVNRCTRGKVLPPLVRDAGTRPLRLPPSALSLPSAPREDEQPLGRIRGPFHTPSHTTRPYQRAPTGRVDGPAPGPSPPPVSTPARKDVRRINGGGAGPPCTRVEDPRYRVALKRRTSVRGRR